MPHAFKATPDHPAVAYLVRLHADIGGKLLDNKKEAARLAASMLAVEHVIKLFDPDFNARTISARRRQKTNPWFKRGTLFREALGVLRTATGPLTVGEITAGVLAAKGIRDATMKQRNGITAGIRSCLESNVGKAVRRVGDGVPRRWQVA
ncbi:MAG: hypothetical protein WB764_21715 [Xanthobacteraceae bacterium]